MDGEAWLIGWRAIGQYIGRSAKTARRWAKAGMPFFRDPAGRPIAKPSQIDDYLVDINREMREDKKWLDEGISTALAHEDYRENQQKEFEQKILEAQRRSRLRFS